MSDWNHVDENWLDTQIDHYQNVNEWIAKCLAARDKHEVKETYLPDSDFQADFARYKAMTDEEYIASVRVLVDPGYKLRDYEIPADYWRETIKEFYANQQKERQEELEEKARAQLEKLQRRRKGPRSEESRLLRKILKFLEKMQSPTSRLVFGTDIC